MQLSVWSRMPPTQTGLMERTRARPRHLTLLGCLVLCTAWQGEHQYGNDQAPATRAKPIPWTPGMPAQGGGTSCGGTWRCWATRCWATRTTLLPCVQHCNS